MKKVLVFITLVVFSISHIIAQETEKKSDDAIMFKSEDIKKTSVAEEKSSIEKFEPVSSKSQEMAKSTTKEKELTKTEPVSTNIEKEAKSEEITKKNEQNFEEKKEEPVKEESVLTSEKEFIAKATKDTITEESPEFIGEEKLDKAGEFSEEDEDDIKLTEEDIGDRGNWYEKREWLVKAREVNNKVQDRIAEIEQIKESFWAKYQDIQEKKLDPFYKSAGAGETKIQELKKAYEASAEQARALEVAVKADVEQAKIDAKTWHGVILNFTEAIIEYIKSFFIKSKKSKEITRSQIEGIFDEEGYEAKMIQLGKDLEKLKTDIKSIDDLDAALAERMEKLNAQIRDIIQESAQSRKLYNEIWEIKDENNARERFFKIKNINKKIKDVIDFIQGEFSTNFNATVESTEQQMVIVTNLIKTIEDGLTLQKDEIASLGEPVKSIEGKSIEIKKEVVGSWYDKLLDTFFNLFGRVYTVTSSLFSSTWSFLESWIGQVASYVESKLGKKEVVVPAQPIREPLASVTPAVAPVVKESKKEEKPVEQSTQESVKKASSSELKSIFINSPKSSENKEEAPVAKEVVPEVLTPIAKESFKEEASDLEDMLDEQPGELEDELLAQVLDDGVDEEMDEA